MNERDPAIPDTVLGNIDAVLAVEQRAERQVPPLWRLAHGLGSFVGSVSFACIHVALFGLWLAANSGVWPALVFDPYPFTLLGTLVSCEAVVLSTFVLIRQNRSEDRVSQRSHLDLQVNLLAEKELTKVLQIVQRISDRVGAEQPADAELEELLANTAVKQMAEKLAAPYVGRAEPRGGVSVITVHLLRHGEHRDYGQRLTGRTGGVGLSDQGREQAARIAAAYVAAAYAGAAVRTVLTSPLQRAWETAQPVAAALGLEPVEEPGLQEIDFGTWAGQRFDALAPAPGWAQWNAARSLACPPGGETMLAVQARAVGVLARERRLGGTVITVSHADVIKAVSAHVLGMPLDLLHRIEIGPASRSVVVLGEDFARVDAVNLPA